MTEMEDVTTEAAVQTYESTRDLFDALLEVFKELSKKKPDLPLTAGQADIINLMLRQLVTIVEEEPEGKILKEFDVESLQQVSDAVMIMVLFEQALDAFSQRYHSDEGWITSELIAELEAEDIEPEDEDDANGAWHEDAWSGPEWGDEDDEDGRSEPIASNG